MATGPTARRRQLGTELRKLREAAHLTQEDAAGVLACSAAKIVNLEKGRYGAKKAELHMLLVEYGVSEDQRELLEEVRKEGNKRGWWSTYGLPRWFQPFVGFENDAESLRTFEPILIPGLFQTEAYARALVPQVLKQVSREEADRNVETKKVRQRRVSEDPPLDIWAIIDESALWRPVGGMEVLIDQLDHLLALTRLANVKIQILETAVGAHASMSGGFCVLSFSDQEDQNLVWLDGPIVGNLVDDYDDVEKFGRIFDELRAEALSPRQSAKWIAEHVRRLRGESGDT